MNLLGRHRECARLRETVGSSEAEFGFPQKLPIPGKTRFTGSKSPSVKSSPGKASAASSGLELEAASVSLDALFEKTDDGG